MLRLVSTQRPEPCPDDFAGILIGAGRNPFLDKLVELAGQADVSRGHEPILRELAKFANYRAVAISAAIATGLPGPGSVYVGQELRFDRPVRAGDTITVEESFF